MPTPFQGSSNISQSHHTNLSLTRRLTLIKCEMSISVTVRNNASDSCNSHWAKRKYLCGMVSELGIHSTLIVSRILSPKRALPPPHKQGANQKSPANNGACVEVWAFLIFDVRFYNSCLF